TARLYLRDSTIALLAAVVPLSAPKFAEWMVVGSQPKLPMIIFGVLSLILIPLDRPLLAGACSMLACLCWQPALMFTGVALLIFSNYLTRWTDVRALKVLLGAALPLAVVTGYFYARGALGDLLAWTITFDYSVFRPETQREPLRALHHMWTVISRVYDGDSFLWILGTAGLIGFLFERVHSAIERREPGSRFKDALVIPPLIYFAFCIVNMQGGPDLIPFIPFVAIFTALTVVVSLRFCYRRLLPRLASRAIRWDLAAAGVALFVWAGLSVGRGVRYHVPPGFTLEDQDNQMRVVSEALGPDGKIYVHGSVELLVLLKKSNLNPYTFLNQGIDRFEASRRGVDLA